MKSTLAPLLSVAMISIPAACGQEQSPDTQPSDRPATERRDVAETDRTGPAQRQRGERRPSGIRPPQPERPQRVMQHLNRMEQAMQKKFAETERLLREADDRTNRVAKEIGTRLDRLEAQVMKQQRRGTPKKKPAGFSHGDAARLLHEAKAAMAKAKAIEARLAMREQELDHRKSELDQRAKQLETRERRLSDAAKDQPHEGDRDADAN